VIKLFGIVPLRVQTTRQTAEQKRRHEMKTFERKVALVTGGASIISGGMNV